MMDRHQTLGAIRMPSMPLSFSSLRFLAVLFLLGATSGAQEFTIPPLDKIPRIDRSSPRPGAEIMRNSAFILKFHKHPVAGESYVILTDHQDPKYLTPLNLLARHHQATMLKVADLASLHRAESREKLKNQLLERNAKYVAIAPRLQSYRENMLLGMWELLTTLDDDPLLDVYPGLLIAPNPASFSALIQRSIKHTPLSQSQFKPIAISQVRTTSETRSLQKAAVLRNVFKQHDIKTPIVAIYGPQTKAAPKLPGPGVWNLSVSARKQFLTTFPKEATTALQNSTVVIMHGHGTQGMSCSVDIDGIPKGSSNQIVLSGSCFAAAPSKSDFPKLSRIPGGYSLSQRESFALRYIDRGATVFFGHMRLSSGFPHLYPVLESWTQGQTVGEAYQQLINGIIQLRGFKSGNFIVNSANTSRRIRQNTLLYVLIGDPALQPFAPFSQNTPTQNTSLSQ